MVQALCAMCPHISLKLLDARIACRKVARLGQRGGPLRWSDLAPIFNEILDAAVRHLEASSLVLATVDGFVPPVALTRTIAMVKHHPEPMAVTHREALEWANPWALEWFDMRKKLKLAADKRTKEAAKAKAAAASPEEDDSDLDDDSEHAGSLDIVRIPGDESAEEEIWYCALDFMYSGYLYRCVR